MPDQSGPGFPRPSEPQRSKSEPTDQQKALDLTRAFRGHDLAELRRLPRSELAEQHRVREDLCEYMHQMYEYIRGFGLGSPASNPGYSAVAGMVNLADALCGNATLVLQETEGDLGG